MNPQPLTSMIVSSGLDTIAPQRLDKMSLFFFYINIYALRACLLMRASHATKSGGRKNPDSNPPPTKSGGRGTLSRGAVAS